MSDWYILKDKIPVKCDDINVFVPQFESEESRRVALDKVGDFTVSTVFLGLDHSFGRGRPILFESMVF